MSQDPATRHSAESTTDRGEKTATGLSEFLGKVLDQLSIDAWLPATMLVGNGAILIQLSRQSDLSLATAITSLTQSTLGVLITLLFAIVLTTMVTQAFSYEVIRLLEGYWGTTRVMSWAMTIRTKRQVRRRKKIHDRTTALNKKAFEGARGPMLESEDISLEQIKNTADLIYGKMENRPNEKPNLSSVWIRFCPPEMLRSRDEAQDRVKHYPELHRVLPTRLGNTLRADEDLLPRQINGDLESLILRNYDRIPEALRSQHDQFRTRLDMYCILVFVFALLAILGPFAVVRDIRSPCPGITVFLLYFILSWVSYEAAIASARGYGSILRVVCERL